MKAVPWKRLNRRALDFLDGYESDAPLFLFVNYFDAHYPYFHAELDRIFEFEPISRKEIRPHLRDGLQDADYLLYSTYNTSLRGYGANRGEEARAKRTYTVLKEEKGMVLLQRATPPKKAETAKGKGDTGATAQ